MRISLRRLASLFVVSLTATCVDSPTGLRTGPGTFAITPVFSQSATAAKATYAAAGLEIDHVRLVITRPPAEVVRDTIVPYTVGQGDLPLELNVIGPVGEQLTVRLDYLSGPDVLYSGTSPVTTVSLLTPASQVPVTPIVIVPVGPGSTAASVTITPSSGTFPSAAPISFTAKAFTAASAEIAGALFAWSVDDETIGTVNAAGVLTPTTKGGPIKVRATTLNGKFAEANVTVTAPITKLGFLVQPSAVVAGAVMAPAVQVAAQDAGGNTATTFNGNITIAIGSNPGGGIIGGTLTATAVAGVATFNNLKLSAAGTGYTLIATSSGLTAAASAAFNVTSGTPVALEFVTQPTNVTQNAAISPPVQVRVVNAFGATVASATNIVTLALAANPGGSTLGGNLSAAALSGVASFSTLTLNNLGTGYTLSASATGLTGATSTSFNVVAPPAATRTWTGAFSTSWADVANWNPGGVPTVSDSVVIAAGTPFSPTLSANANIRALVVKNSAVLNIGAVQLQASAKITNQGTLNLTASTLTGALENQATVLVQGGVTVAGLLTNAAGATLTIQGSSVVGAAGLIGVLPITNSGTIELTDAVSGTGATLAASVSITNTATGVINALQGVNGQRVISGAIDNQGTIAVLGTQGLSVSQTTTNSVNSGTINVTSGNLTIGQSGPTASFTNSGTITVGSGRTMTINGGAATFVSGLLTGATGTLSLQGVALSMTTAAMTVPLTVNAATTIVGGTLTIPSGQELVLVSSTFSSSIVLQGTLTARRTNSITGTFSNATGSVLRALGISSSGDLTIANGFTNNGTIQLTDSVTSYGASLTVTSGALVNPAGGQIQPLQGSNGARTLTAELSNAGTITISGSQGLTLNKTGAAHTNSGTISVTSGNLTVTQSTGGSFTNTGTITVPSTRTLTLTGGSALLGDNLVSGAGSVNLNAVGITFTPRTSFPVITSDAATVFNGGTLTIGATDELTFVSSTLSSNVVLNGMLTMRRTNSITGSFTNASGSTLRAFGLSSSGDLTIAAGFTNAGTIQLTDSVTSYGASLTITTGQLANPATGQIQPLQGANGSRTLNAELNNAGTITIGGTQGLTINKTGAAHTNSGTIAVTTGNLTVTQSTGGTFTNTGSITVPTSRTLTMTGGTAVLGDNLVTGVGSVILNAVALSFAPRTSFPVITSDAATVFNGGTLTIGAGEGLTFVSSTIGSNVSLSGMLTMRRTNSITGTFTNVGGSFLRAFGLSSSGDLTIANGFTNNGTIQLTDSVTSYGASLAITTGQLLNSSSGQIQVLQGANGSRLLAAELSQANGGALTITGTQGLTINRTGAAHTINGSIILTTGDLSVVQSTGGSFTTTANITVPAGRTLSFSGGSATLGNSLVTGAGSVDLTGVAVSFTPRTTFPVITSNAATVFNGGTLTIGAGEQLTFVSSTISSNVSLSGMLTMRRTNSITGTFTNASGSTLRAFGLSSSGDLTIANGFTNNGTIQLTDSVTSYGASLIVAAGTLTNPVGGSIQPLQGSNGSRILNAQLSNAGTINLTNTQGLTINRTGGVHTNSGTIQLTSGNLTITQSAGGSFTTTGSITVPTGRTLAITGGSATLGNGWVTGAGSVTLTGVATSFEPRTLFPVITSDAATVFNGGTLVIPDTVELTFVSSTISSNVTLNGMLTMRRTNAINGTLTKGPFSTLRAFGLSSGGDLTVANGFTNNGTIQLTDSVTSYGASLSVTNGTLTNPVSGSLQALQGSNGSRLLNAQLSNAGTINLTNTQGLTINKTGGVHTNSGTIQLTSGNLTVTQSAGGSFTTTGAITVPTGRTLAISGGSAALGNGLVTGVGSVTLTGVATSFSPRTQFPVITSDAATVFNLGTLIIPDTVQLTFVSSTISSSVVLNGMLTMRRTNSITGTVTKGASSTLRAFGLSSSGDLTIANGFINNGTIQLTDSVTSYGASLTITTGTLLNASGATLTPLAGSGGARTLTAAVLDNQGSLTVPSSVAFTIAAQLANSATFSMAGNAGVTLNKSGAAHVNSGTISMPAITSGSLTIGGTGTQTFSNAGMFSVGSGRSVILGASTGFTNSVGGVYAASGSLTVPSTSTFTNTGTIEPGGVGVVGTMSYSGTWNPGSGGTLKFDQGNSAADQIAISGNATIGGTLTAAWIAPTNTISFTLMSISGTRSGAFGTINLASGCSNAGANPNFVTNCIGALQ